MNNRTEQFHFFATPEEAKLIRDREKEIGILNESAYLRKMAIDNELKEALKDKAHVIRISLFGITTIEGIHMAIKQAWISEYNKDKKWTGVVKKAKWGKKIAGKLDFLPEWIRGIATTDWLSFVEIKNVIEEKHVVLVFDDLERCCLDTVDVLGAINDYCENQKFHTIIVANQDKMGISTETSAIPIEFEIDTFENGDDTDPAKRTTGKIKYKSQKDADELSYNEIKEKIIHRTVQYIPDYAGIVNTVIEKTKYQDEKYKGFVKECEEGILELFAPDRNTYNESQNSKRTHNIRSLKCAIRDFYRVYAILVEKGFEDIDKRFYSFISYMIAYKATRRIMFGDSGLPVILTSATITSGKNEDYIKNYTYFINNTGFQIERSLVCEPIISPFNYDEHAKIYYTEHMPHPTRERDKFIEEGVREIIKLLYISNGKSLILFTAKTDMQAVYDRLQKENLPFKILMQQGNAKQAETLEKFRNDTNSVLLGTGSYWEGINIEGVSLSHVIIFKLPFPVREPIIDYKYQQSKDGLMEVSVPEMVIKLKQGIGRLIRSESDKGIVSIIDSRVGKTSKAPYKQIIWESLPIKSKTNKIEKIAAFYSQVVEQQKEEK